MNSDEPRLDCPPAEPTPEAPPTTAEANGAHVEIDPLAEREALDVGAAIGVSTPIVKHTNGNGAYRPRGRRNSAGPSLADRAPPHDAGAEAAIIGSILWDSSKIELASDLRADEFYREPHRQIWIAMRALHAAGIGIDSLTVTTWLRDRGRSVQVRAPGYLIELVSGVAAASARQVAAFATTIRAKARVRQFIETCARIAAEGRLDIGDEQEFIARSEGAIAKLAAENPRESRALTAAVVLDQWALEGRIVHEPTGIDALDERTGGGPIYGTRWLVVGAPDAGKTALLVQIAHTYALRGICVGLLCVDEEPGDIVTRIAQRSGWSRDDCEHRESDAIDRMREDLSELPLRLYGDEHTVESAAADLATWARKVGKRAMFGVDSIQTASSDATRTTTRELGPREIVTANVRALRSVATKHRLIALATSEMNREGYKRKRGDEPSNDMGSAAESRVVEYLAKVMVALHSVAGGRGDVEMKLAKNKHGPSWRSEEDSLFYSLDRARQTFAPTKAPEGANGDGATDDKRVRGDMALVATTLARRPGLGVRALRDAMRGEPGGFADGRTGVALSRLTDPAVGAVVALSGPRGAKYHYVDGVRMGSLLDLIPLQYRPLVAASRPPETVAEC
jgi:replicative DNA helicase